MAYEASKYPRPPSPTYHQEESSLILTHRLQTLLFLQLITSHRSWITTLPLESTRRTVKFILKPLEQWISTSPMTKAIGIASQSVMCGCYLLVIGCSTHSDVCTTWVCTTILTMDISYYLTDRGGLYPLGATLLRSRLAKSVELQPTPRARFLYCDKHQRQRISHSVDAEPTPRLKFLKHCCGSGLGSQANTRGYTPWMQSSTTDSRIIRI